MSQQAGNLHLWASERTHPARCLWGVAPPPGAAPLYLEGGPLAGRPSPNQPGGAKMGECKTWQGFLQIIHYLASRGYYWYCITQYPSKKRDKFFRIDEKLIGKYRCDLSKFQRARRKKKGLANFYFARFDDCAIIMHTKGDIEENILYDDRFYDFRQKRLKISINNLEFELINLDGKLSWKLSKDCYRDIKAHFGELCKLKQREKIVKEFDKLNGLPAWKGIIRQKYLLRNYIIAQAKKHQIQFHQSDFRINTRRKIHKIF